MDLHQCFVQLGLQRKNLTRQLQFLLPEIYKQEIFKKHNCATIYEYAWKFAGFSRSLVDKVICTVRHLEHKPFLMKVVATHGIHKVAMVATLATPETDKIFAQHVKTMSKPALFEYAKEIRRNLRQLPESSYGLFEASFVDGKSMDGLTPDSAPCCAVPEKIKIELDDEMQIIFLQLKKNLQKEFKREFSNKEALTAMLRKLAKGEKAFMIKGVLSRQRTAGISEKLTETKSIPGNENNVKFIPPKGANPKEKLTRYIKVSRKREMFTRQQRLDDRPNMSGEFIQICSYPGCNKPYMIIHHRDRFAISKSHDSIIPLCKEHHEFCHNGLVKNEAGDPQNWRLNLKPRLNFTDELVLKYRKA